MNIPTRKYYIFKIFLKKKKLFIKSLLKKKTTRNPKKFKYTVVCIVEVFVD